VIENFDPTKLTVDPTDGNPVMIFTYTTTDAAGVESDPATVTMPFLGEMHLGDTVWMDDNGNGAQDPGEKGVPGVKVELLDEDGNVIDTATTDADGHYEFVIREPGKYRVRFDEGLYYTKDCPPCNSENDSNVHGQSNTTDLITMDWGDTDMSIDAGVTPTAHIGDYFWFDDDKDGIQDPGEKGVDGGLVELLDADGNKLYWTDESHSALTTEPTEYPAETTTDSDGKYGFDVPAGNRYKVRFTIPQKYRDDGYVFTGANIGSDAQDSDVSENGVVTVAIDAVAGENRITLDAGINCGCDEVASDSGDAMSKLAFGIMMLLTMSMALILVRRETQYKGN
jgi:hypothetical protein